MIYDIAIIGTGPRGLAVAIQALEANLSVLLLDKDKPGSSWSMKFIDPNMIMRSPTSFDLVSNTSLKCSIYSLAHFTNYKGQNAYINNLEADPSYVIAEIFHNYLLYVFELLKIGGAHYQQIEINDIIFENNIFTLNNNIQAKAVVSATGYFSNPIYRRTPNWITTAKATDVYSFWRMAVPKNKKIIVYGASQASADVIKVLLKANNEVWLISSRELKGARYPAPSKTEWKEKSVFSDYFESLNDLDKVKFINDVAKWQPSILEEDLKKILNNSNMHLLPFTPGLKISSEEPLTIEGIGIFDHIFYSLGHDYDFKKEKYVQNLKICNNKYISTIPELTNNFKVSNIPFYFTGRPALFISGPNQESVISSGKTAIKIVSDIKNNF